MTVEGDSDALAEAIAELVERLTLINIRCIKANAELKDVSPEPPTRIRVELPDKVLYAVGEGFLGAKFMAAASVFDEDGNETAHVETVHVIEHALDAGELPTRDVLSAYLHTNGFFMVYPYIRQTVQEAFARIGYGSLVLGILTRDSTLPIRLEMSVND